MAEIDYALRDNEDSKTKANKIERDLLEQNLPKNFNPEDPANILKKQLSVYSDICITLESYGCQNPKNLTVFDFYSRIKYYEKKAKATNQKT